MLKSHIASQHLWRFELDRAVITGTVFMSMYSALVENNNFTPLTEVGVEKAD